MHIGGIVLSLLVTLHKRPVLHLLVQPVQRASPSYCFWQRFISSVFTLCRAQLQKASAFQAWGILKKPARAAFFGALVQVAVQSAANSGAPERSIRKFSGRQKVFCSVQEASCASTPVSRRPCRRTHAAADARRERFLDR